MPIRDRTVYPPDWDERSLAVKQAAGWRCSEDCDRPHYARGLCRLHYRRARAAGDPLPPLRPQPLKHGHRRSPSETSPTWMSWRAMIGRCCNPNASDYPRYGGRGITVCDRWRHDFVTFLQDVGERPEGTSLERIDVNGNYEPGNVRWATTKEQGHNRRTTRWITHRGRTQPLAAWAEQTGIHRATIALRLKKGWSVEDALTTRPMPRADRGILGLRAQGRI